MRWYRCVAIGLVCIAPAATSGGTCDESNALQWTCYTPTDEPGEVHSLRELAAKLHVNPQRLADLNTMAGEDMFAPGLVPAGHALRVPFGAKCEPQSGLWQCYQAYATGESLAAIASSASTGVWRSAAGVYA